MFILGLLIGGILGMGVMAALAMTGPDAGHAPPPSGGHTPDEIDALRRDYLKHGGAPL